MKCNEIGTNKPRHHMNLDEALHDLGMLSTITEARNDYLRESKSNYGVVRLNTRYVSNVTVGYCMKKATNKNRLCPYVVPARHRTKSENSESTGNADSTDCLRDFKNNVNEPSTSGYGKESYNDAIVNKMLKYNSKRCQSLENLNLSVDSPQGLECSPDMDCVSTRIQKLHVDE